MNLCKCLKGLVPSNIICYVDRSTERNFNEEGLSGVKSQSRDEPEQNIEESLLLFDEKEKEQACILSEPTQTQISGTQKRAPHRTLLIFICGQKTGHTGEGAEGAPSIFLRV